MKFFGCFFLVTVLLSFLSCKDENDKEGNLTIHFKAFYDGQPVRMFESKAFTAPQQLRFTHLSFLVSDLTLFKASSPLMLRDLELVDMSFSDLTGAEEGYTIRTNNISAGQFDGISFGIGVPPDVNAKRPENFPSSSPLSNPGYYWMGWNSYIFMKTEGQLDTMGTSVFNLGFAYHTGINALYRSFSIPVSINIEGGKNKDITLIIDYKKVLEDVNIKSNPLNSNPNDSTQIGMIVHNLPSALTLVQ